MRRITLIVLLGLLLATGLWAQPIGGSATVTTATSDPPTCKVGALLARTDLNVMKACFTANVWTTIGPSVSTITYRYEPVGQGGTPGWPISWDALTNYTQSTVDSSDISPYFILAASQTGSSLRLYSAVDKTITGFTLTASASAAAGGGTDGSIAVTYACVGDADWNAPAAGAVSGGSPLALSTLLTTVKTYSTAITIPSCAGTAASPKKLIVWLAATAGNQNLNLFRFTLTY